MDKTYRKLIEDIKVQEEKLADKGMLSVYAEQKVALDKLHSLVGMLYIKYANNGLLDMTTQQKASNSFKQTLKTMGKELGTSEVSKVTDILGNVYKDTYYKNAFVQDSGLKVGIKFNMLKKEYVDAAVNTEYAGEMFSSRIWNNKASMIDTLQTSLIEAMKGNITIDKIGKQIKDTFNVTAYESQRLVNTENARVQSQANDDIGVSSGVSQQMYSATLDNKTSSECANDDGKVWDIDDPDKITPPENHPLCRCCLINMPFPGWTPTQRKDNQTKGLIDNTTYNDWKKEKGIE